MRSLVVLAAIGMLLGIACGDATRAAGRIMMDAGSMLSDVGAADAQTVSDSESVRHVVVDVPCVETLWLEIVPANATNATTSTHTMEASFELPSGITTANILSVSGVAYDFAGASPMPCPEGVLCRGTAYDEGRRSPAASSVFASIGANGTTVSISCSGRRSTQTIGTGPTATTTITESRYAQRARVTLLVSNDR